MLSKNTYYKMSADTIELIEKNKNLIYSFKTILINLIRKKKGYKYLNTFILGNNQYIDDKVIESYQINGISHLFSVSGMHISLLSSIILYFLNKFKKSNFNYILVIFFLIIYTFLINFTPSVIRATLLFIFLIINKLFKLNLSTLKILLFILCLILFINPYNIYNIGFIFSYTISFYLIIFSNLINNYKGYLKKIFMTSFISFLASIPILINNFYSINLLTIINNIIFVPFVSIITFPLSLLTLFIPKLDILFSIIVTVLEGISIFLYKFKIELIMCHVNIIIVLVYYFVITFILYKLNNKQYKHIFILIIMLFIHTNINNLKKELYITFIDVGQGDSSFIHLPYNKSNILIDTGGIYNYNISKNIISYLKSIGIKKLDYLIITHGDYDHMGETINLVENFKVDKVIFNCGEFNELEQELIKELDKKKIPYYSCIKELNINNNKLYFLNNKDYKNENDNSSVIYTELNNHKFLFMGDVGVKVETDLINKYNLQDIDVLKVGHHGSMTSSSKNFIDEINPEYSIISVGKNNKYSHPNKEVLNNLEDSTIYRTDRDGSIMFKIKNNKLNVETCIP